MTARQALLLFAAAGCGAPADPWSGDGVLLLPPVLREVSGICMLDGEHIACVQDELGVLFRVALADGAIAAAQPFGPPGDYEGLARVGTSYWVLRSDGVLLELDAAGAEPILRRSVQLPTQFREWEALGFDAVGARLLVLPKHGVGATPAERDQRPLFAVDPVAARLLAEPVAVFDRRRLRDALLAFEVPLPTRTGGGGRTRTDLALACSALLPGPGADELLLLSAVDGLLLRVGLDGQLRGAARLDATALPQPEGLAMLPDGRLLVASESGGRAGQGRLAVVAVP